MIPLCVAVVSSCVNLRKISTYPEPEFALRDKYLVQKEGKVDIALETTLAPEYRNTHTGIRVEPAFDDNVGGKTALPSFVLEGGLHETFNRRMNRFRPEDSDDAHVRKRYGKDGSQALYTVTIPYADWMGGASFYADLYADAYARKHYLGRVLIANGLLDLTSLMQFTLYQTYRPYEAPGAKRETVIKTENFQLPDSILFGFDSYRIPWAPQTLDSFREYMTSLRKDPALKGYTVTVLAGNSPEGPVEYNRELGRKRLNSLMSLLSETDLAPGSGDDRGGGRGLGDYSC